MTAVLADQHIRQFQRIGQIAVMGQADAVRRIHVEGLRLGCAIGARGGIAHMADAHVAAQFQHVVLLEGIAHQTAALADRQRAAGGRGDAGGVLAAVLQHRERIVQTLIDGTGPDDPHYSAHARPPAKVLRRHEICRGNLAMLEPIATQRPQQRRRVLPEWQ